MRLSVEDVIRVGVAATLGGIGGAAGFKHTHDWAAANGQHGWLAWAVAVVVEGIAVVAGFEIRRDHRRGYRRRVTFPMVVLVTGFGIQMAAQVALAPPTPAGWLLAAMPALGFLVVVKLLMRSPAPIPAPAPVTAEPAQVIPVASLAPAPVVAEPDPPVVPVTRLRLPASMREALTATAERAASEGRPVTADDVRATVKVPAAMAEQLAADLTADHPARPINGHPVTT